MSTPLGFRESLVPETQFPRIPYTGSPVSENTSYRKPGEQAITLVRTTGDHRLKEVAEYYVLVCVYTNLIIPLLLASLTP